MENLLYIRAFLALAAICCLIGLLALAAKKWGLSEKLTGRMAGVTRQLALIETLPLDAKRRIVLVKRGETGHLLLLGPGGDVVIERGIMSPTRHPGESQDDESEGRSVGIIDSM